jgi:multidrug efflux pump subunit AcrB
MRKLVTAFAQNTVFANILLAMFFMAGGLALSSMVRETFPEFSLDMITIKVIWPGADPEEVEEGICRKIEEAIDGIDGIKQYNTISSENVGMAYVEVSEDYEVDDVKERVRNVVEAISTFPKDAERPITEELLLRNEVMMIALSGENMSERSLKEWGERVKEEIRALPGVSQVLTIGARDYEVSIEISEDRLREYGLTFEGVAAIVRANSLNLSGGSMRTEGEEIRLRTVGRRYTAREFAELVLLARPNGDVITLDRVADVRDGFVEDEIISQLDGESVVTVVVMKTQDEDTLGISREVEAYLARKTQQLPEGLRMIPWADNVGILQARISLLTRNGAIGLVVVFVLLWLFLDIRLSFWAGMGMPISVAGALAVMWAVGATINMISLFGLIMVLGIIVDDAIVVGEAIYVARRRGAAPMQAAVEGVMEVGMPVIAAVATSIVAFVPLMYIGGIMGKFISILPVVVIACLAISLVECLVLLPAHLSHLPDFNKESHGGNPIRRLGRNFHRRMNRGLEWFVEHCYTPFLAGAVRWRYVSAAISAAVLLGTMGYMQSGRLKFVVFPPIDGSIAIANIEFPNGTPLEVTQEAVEDIEAALHRIAARMTTQSGEPLIKHIYSTAGMQSSEGPGSYGNHLGGLQADLLEPERRGIYRQEILHAWEKEVGAVPGAVAVNFSGGSHGPPGSPIEVWLQGHDLDAILGASKALKAELATFDGVYQIQDDFRLGKNELKLRLKPEATTLGLSVADLATQIQAGYFGAQALRLQRGKNDIRVRVRYPMEDRKRRDALDQVRIRTPQGFEVPLHSVAEVTYGPGMAAIQRTDGMRRVSVTAEVDYATANPSEVFENLNSAFFPQLRSKYPDVRISMQGEKKKSRESFGSLLVTYPLALLGIFVIVATIFRSYVQPLIIMVTVPFGIIGAVFGHILLGYQLSMMSFFGMVALSGVVVNDAIVLIECINKLLSQGIPLQEAIQQGGARRFRAIFLTSLSTVGGLTPLIMEKDMQAQFLVPMAISIAAGVAFATLLTLLLIPCLLCILNDARRIVFRIRFLRWPTPEEVEPALERVA